MYDILLYLLQCGYGNIWIISHGYSNILLISAIIGLSMDYPSITVSYVEIYNDYKIRVTQDTDPAVSKQNIEAREQHIFSPKNGFCVEIQWCTWG